MPILASAAARLVPQLLPRRGDHFIEARFATVRGIPMDDAALGRPIDGRDERANIFGGRLGRRASALLQFAQPASHTAIVERARDALSCAFGRRSCVSHG